MVKQMTSRNNSQKETKETRRRRRRRAQRRTAAVPSANVQANNVPHNTLNNVRHDTTRIERTHSRTVSDLYEVSLIYSDAKNAKNINTQMPKMVH